MIFNPANKDDLVSYYTGSWRFIRQTEDCKSEQNATVEGVARFSPKGQTLDYTETGIMNCGDYHGTVTQHYIYNFTGPFEADILFSDHRFFHKLNLQTGEASVAHWCSPDQYDGHYKLVDQAKWTLEWKIIGPRKDCIISTAYHRLVS